MKKGPVIRRTFFAMFYGWLVCNAAFLMIASILEFVNMGRILFAFFLLFYSLLFSGMAIFLAWLLVVIPIDQCLADDSFIREKPWSCGVGAVIGFMTVFLPLALSPSDTHFLNQALFSCFGAITGFTVGYYLAKQYPPVGCQDNSSVPAQILTPD